jgi:hypothetical protein
LEIRSKDPCPCGSGKKYKHCCKKHDLKKKNSYQFLFFLAPIVIIGIGLILWSQRSDRPSFQQAFTGQVPTATASQDQSPLPDGRTPEPWEHDTPRNRHWDPNHNHWHDGPPPPASQRTVGPPAAAPQATNPNIPNPEPYQYDPETDQHFDPAHKHWHQGPPPPEDQRNASSPTVTTTSTSVTTTAGTNPDIPNPEPYQYDPVTNQYYDPDHKHWHSGTPPADKTEGASATVQTEVRTEESDQ